METTFLKVEYNVVIKNDDLLYFVNVKYVNNTLHFSITTANNGIKKFLEKNIKRSIIEDIGVFSFTTKKVKEKKINKVVNKYLKRIGRSIEELYVSLAVAKLDNLINDIKKTRSM